jgi:hypothetical protein
MLEGVLQLLAVPGAPPVPIKRKQTETRDENEEYE